MIYYIWRRLYHKVASTHIFSVGKSQLFRCDYYDWRCSKLASDAAISPSSTNYFTFAYRLGRRQAAEARLPQSRRTVTPLVHKLQLRIHSVVAINHLVCLIPFHSQAVRRLLFIT